MREGGFAKRERTKELEGERKREREKTKERKRENEREKESESHDDVTDATDKEGADDKTDRRRDDEIEVPSYERWVGWGAASNGGVGGGALLAKWVSTLAQPARERANVCRRQKCNLSISLAFDTNADGMKLFLQL